MLRELLKDPKNLINAGAIIIALALIWLNAEQSKENAANLAVTNEVIRANTGALSENTAVVKQFQLLLLEVSRDKNLRSQLINNLTKLN